MRHTYTYCKEYEMRLGKPFRDLDNLFIHWLVNHFGTGSCFDRRFLKNHVADIDVETKRYQPRFSFSLHPIEDVVDGHSVPHMYPDLTITALTGARFGIRKWIIGFDQTAFDFDPLHAIQTNMMQAKLAAPQHQVNKLGMRYAGGSLI